MRLDTLYRIADFIWPTLRPLEGLKEKRNADITAIRAADFSANEEIALQEARNIFNREHDRLTTVQGRASIYLGVVTGTIPVLFSLLTNFFLHDFEKNPAFFQAVVLALFFIGLAYLVRAAFWTFDALRVGTTSRVDATDMIEIWKATSPAAELTEELLAATRFNWDATNRKVSSISMAHSFANRAILFFIALLVCIMVLRPLLGTIVLEYHFWAPTVVVTA